MRTWRKIVLSITPKAHIFEKHAIDSMLALNVMGDNTKDFIELSDQDGARQVTQKQGLREYKQKHGSQHKTEHQE